MWIGNLNDTHQDNYLTMEEIFKLRNQDEYIELVKLLKLKQIAQTGGHAKILVEDGLVEVNGNQEFRKRNKLRAGDVVTIQDLTITIVR